MKKSLIGLSLLALAFVACKKEVTFDDQLVGQWNSTQVKIGGADASAGNSVNIHLESSREFDTDVTTYQFGPTIVSSFTGTWSADEVKQELYLKYDTGERETYDITEINETTMRATTVVDNVRREFVFEKQGR
jgi:hypothetical protein